MQRHDFFTIENGPKAKLPFSDGEYERRLEALRALMTANNLDAVLFTSMHNVAYASGFLYCAFGRPYACVITETECTTISANRMTMGLKPSMASGMWKITGITPSSGPNR